MVTPYQERELEFANSYEDFEHADLLNLIVATGDWLEHLLFDPTAVDVAMTSLYQAIVGDSALERPGTPWRELWKDLLADYDLLRSSQYLVSLNAFAFWGLRPDLAFFGIKAEDGNVTDAVGRYISRGRNLLDAIPSGWGTISDVERIVLAAEGRFRLDSGRGVKPEQLAALARVSVKSIRNLLTPKGGSSDMKLNNESEIANTDCRRWLESRRDFKNSLWQSADRDMARENAVQNSTGDLGEVLFVPVARDGSWFDPLSCRNARGYMIGPKGVEEPVDDYREAVDRLARMSTPYWRRPNKHGNWGIVSGVSWQRKVRAELALDPQERA
jgi:hypothetical protein